ncbi:MAG TPA: type I methionyl aminopeptidase [Clostridia bacterium]|nr:type I methionyl aminopeptidase [Clostridia bacterium]
MIIIKNSAEIDLMRKAGKVVGDVLKFLEEKICAGMTTKQLDELAENFIRRAGATPSFLHFEGFPASICASIDEEVVHGIPSNKVIKEGMIVSVDVGAKLNGFQGDAARTFLIGEVSEEKRRLVEITKECFYKGVEQFVEGNRLGDIGAAVQMHAEDNGYSVVRALVGHGIGREMHEEPSVPNYGRFGRGVKLEKGLVLAIEPMINVGTYKVATLENGWTVVTADGKPSAHYENTVALTDKGAEILTL